MRCADCGLYECILRSPLGGCPNGEAVEQTVIITAPDPKPYNLGNGPLDKGYEPTDAMKLLEEKIKLVSEKKTWDGVDVDKCLAELRGHDTKPYNLGNGPWDKDYEPSGIYPTDFDGIKLAASDLVDAVERYMRQECLRSELAMKKDKLKALLHE